MGVDVEVVSEEGARAALLGCGVGGKEGELVVVEVHDVEDVREAVDDVEDVIKVGFASCKVSAALMAYEDGAVTALDVRLEGLAAADASDAASELSTDAAR